MLSLCEGSLRMTRGDTRTPHGVFRARASKIWIRGGCLSWYGLTWRQLPMIAVKEYNRTACELTVLKISISIAVFLVWPPRDTNAQFHSNRSLPLLLRASYQCWFNHLPCWREWAKRKNNFSIIRIPRDFLRFPLAYVLTIAWFI